MAISYTAEEITEILNDYFSGITHKQYVGARYVPIFGRKDEDSIIWDNTGTYEPLTIVLYQGNSYTSRQHVPIGIEISNTDYWANTGNYNAQIEQYRQDVENMATQVSSVSTTAENAYELATGNYNSLNNKVFPISIIDSVTEYQCKSPVISTLTNTHSSLQGFCYSDDDDTIYAIHHPSSGSDNLYLTAISLLTNSYSTVDLEFDGHANTVTESPDNTLILSGNENGEVYEIEKTGAFVRTIDFSDHDVCIAYDFVNGKYVGYNNNMLYYFDDSFNLLSTKTCSINATGIYNICVNDEIVYISSQGSVVYCVNVNSGECINAFRVNYNIWREYEGVTIIDNQLYAGFGYYDADVTTFDKLNVNLYDSKVIYNNNFVSGSTTYYTDNNVEYVKTNGSSSKKFMSFVIAMAQCIGSNALAIYPSNETLKGPRSNLPEIQTPGSLVVNSSDSSFIIDNSINVSGTGKVEFDYITFSSGNIQFYNALRIILSNCTVSSDATVKVNRNNMLYLLKTTINSTLYLYNGCYVYYHGHNNVVKSVSGAFDSNLVKFYDADVSGDDLSALNLSLNEMQIFKGMAQVGTSSGNLDIPLIGARYTTKIILEGSAYSSNLDQIITVFIQLTINNANSLTIAKTSTNGTTVTLKNLYGRS